MRLRVLLFGPLAEIYGTREEWLDLGAAPTAADVYQHYRQRDARLGQLEKSLHIAVNQTIVGADHLLTANDEVALLPPVCGGSSESDQPDLIELTETPLEDHPWRRHLQHAAGSSGAITSFEGLVRNDLLRNDSVADSAVAGEDPVTALVFDAYRPMAMHTLSQLASQARQRWRIQAIVLLHRLGMVPAGGICVVVGVATAHREESFAACKFLIDTLKTTVPIWKKEITDSSSRWVEGALIPVARTGPVTR